MVTARIGLQALQNFLIGTWVAPKDDCLLSIDMTLVWTSHHALVLNQLLH